MNKTDSTKADLMSNNVVKKVSHVFLLSNNQIRYSAHT